MADILSRIAAIQQRVADAAIRSGRTASEVTLVGASKRQPVETVRAVVEAGVVHLGENRVQECEQKQASLPSELEWHLIGPLQSNKVNLALDLFDVIQTVDRLKIAERLQRRAAQLDRIVPIFIEVNLGSEPSKHGFALENLDTLVNSIPSWDHLAVQGLMAIPPFTSSAEASRPWFRSLRQLRNRLFETTHLQSAPGYLSMGMSGDFEVAIEEGATHVRVGTALFGTRA